MYKRTLASLCVLTLLWGSIPTTASATENFGEEAVIETAEEAVAEEVVSEGTEEAVAGEVVSEGTEEATTGEIEVVGANSTMPDDYGKRQPWYSEMKNRVRAALDNMAEMADLSDLNIKYDMEFAYASTQIILELADIDTVYGYKVKSFTVWEGDQGTKALGLKFQYNSNWQEYKKKENSWQEISKQRLIEAAKKGVTAVDVTDLSIYYGNYMSTKMKEDLLNLLEEVWKTDNLALYIEDIYAARGNSSDLTYFRLSYTKAYQKDDNSLDLDKVNKAAAFFNKALGTVNNNMSDMEKAYAVYRYVIDNTEIVDKEVIDQLNRDCNYEAFVKRKADSYGVADAIRTLLEKVGVSCRSGLVVDESGKSYYANAVTINDVYYYIDAVKKNFWITMDELNATRKGTQLTNYTMYPNYLMRKSGYAYYNNRLYSLSSDGILQEYSLEGKNTATYTGLGKINSVVDADGDLFLCSDKGIYVAKNLSKGELDLVWQPIYHPGYHAYKCVNIKKVVEEDCLEIALEGRKRNPKDNSWSVVKDTEKVPLSYRENGVKPTLKVVSVDTKNVAKVSSPEMFRDCGVNAVLQYSTGIKIPVDAYDLTYSINTEGSSALKQVDVSFEGLSSSFNVTIDSKWKFKDVYSDSSDWIYKAVKSVTDKGYMVGTTGETFNPNGKLERCMLVQILYNKEKKPESKYQKIFSDVEDGQWYTSAILWAQEKGLVSGYPDGRFGVHDYITREQLAQILYKYAQMNKKDVSEKGDLTKFTDSVKMSSWSKDALSWCVSKKIMNGKSATVLDPLGNATRAEAATMIMHYDELDK